MNNVSCSLLPRGGGAAAGSGMPSPYAAGVSRESDARRERRTPTSSFLVREAQKIVRTIRDRPSRPEAATIHFWTSRKVDEAQTWQPDLEPSRYLSGYSHSLLELHARLRDAGYSVTIGDLPGRRTSVVVASLEELSAWMPAIPSSLGLRLAAAALICPRIVVIRGDVPLSTRTPSFVGLEVLPNRSSIRYPDREIHLPLFPQRGLVKRDPARGTTIRCMAIKAFSGSLPSFIHDPHFIDALNSLGIALRCDTENDVPLRWPDFRQVDVALCMRDPQPEGNSHHDGHINKPATKLVNAWRAGAIPLVGDEVAYRELVKRDSDAIRVGSPADVLAALQELQSDTTRVAHLLESGSARAAAFDTSVLVTSWYRLLACSTIHGSRRKVLAYVVTAGPKVLFEVIRHRKWTAFVRFRFSRRSADARWEVW